MKDENDADDPAFRILDRRGRVLDGYLGTVAQPKDCVMSSASLSLSMSMGTEAGFRMSPRWECEGTSHFSSNGDDAPRLVVFEVINLQSLKGEARGEGYLRRSGSGRC